MFQVAKAVSHSLNNCVNCLPGQKDVDMALKSIGEASKKLLIETVSLGCESPDLCQQNYSHVLFFKYHAVEKILEECNKTNHL